MSNNSVQPAVVIFDKDRAEACGVSPEGVPDPTFFAPVTKAQRDAGGVRAVAVNDDGEMVDADGNVGGVPVGMVVDPVTGVIEINGLQLIPGVVINDVSAATSNTAAINLAISQGGDFSLTHQGTIYVSSSIRVPSNTSLYIGGNTTIKAIDGVAFPVIENYNYSTAEVATLSAGELTFSGQTATLAHTGIGASFPVGSYIAVLNSTTDGWCGVYGPIRTSANDSITWLMESAPSATPAVGTIKVHVADHHIKIWGPGTIDPNRAGTTGDGDTTMYTRGTRWYKVAHLTLDDYKIKASRGWTNAIACAYDVQSTRLRPDSVSASGTDGINITSPSRKIRIRDLQASVSDNAVGLNVLDTSYAYVGQLVPCACGEIDDVGIEGVNCLLPYTTSIIGMWGRPNSRFGRVKISGIRGTVLTGGAVVSANLYAPKGLTGVSGKSLIISDVDVKSPVPILSMNGNGNWSNITLEGNKIFTGQVLCNINMSNTYTIGALTINGVSADQNITVDAIVIGGGVSINKLSVNDVVLATSAAGIELITSSATIDEFNVNNTRYNQGGSGQVITLAGAYPVGTINVSNTKIIGGGSGGALVYQSTVAALVIGAINVSNVSVKGLNAVLDLQNPTQASATEISFAGVQCESCNQAIAGYTPYNAKISGYTDKTAMTNNPFGCLSSGVSYSINISSAKTIKSNLVNLAAGALLRATGGSDMRIDGDKLTGTPIAGDQFWNTNAASTFGSGTSKVGLYGYTGSAWTKTFGPA